MSCNLHLYFDLLFSYFHFTDNCIRLQEFPISFELTEETCSYYEGKNLVSLLLFMKTNSIHFISLNFKMVGDICVIGTFVCQWCIFGTPCWCKNWLWCQLCHNLDFDIFSNYRIFSIQHMSPVNLHCIFFKFKYLFHWDAFNLFLKSVCTWLYFWYTNKL